jgi:hypothetical protein
MMGATVTLLRHLFIHFDIRHCLTGTAMQRIPLLINNLQYQEIEIFISRLSLQSRPSLRDLGVRTLHFTVRRVMLESTRKI